MNDTVGGLLLMALFVLLVIWAGLQVDKLQTRLRARALARHERRAALATSRRLDAIAQATRVQMLGEVLRYRHQNGSGASCPVCGQPRHEG